MASGQFTPTSGHSLGDGFWDCCECDGANYPSTSQPLQNARGMEHGAWSMEREDVISSTDWATELYIFRRQHAVLHPRNH